MVAVLSLLRAPGPARRFFLAYAQSSLGTGITLVALPLVALERYGSPFAISAVLLAEFLPLMLLGMQLGALADRWPRRGCVVAADAVRFVALVGVVLTDSLPATMALVAVIGAATGVWRPAAMAGLSTLEADGDDRAATALYGTVTNVTRTGGALVAGLLFSLLSPAGALAIDAATFGLSALLLLSVPLGRAPAASAGGPERAPTTDRAPGLTAFFVTSGAVVLAAGIANVAEPIFVVRDLDAGASAFAVALAAWAIGGAVGAMTGTRSTTEHAVRRRLVTAIGLAGLGFLVTGTATALPVVALGFALNGFGNGAAVVHQRLFVRRLVDEARLGRAFGLLESVSSWAFVAALMTGGVLAATAGARTTVLIAGAATVGVALLAARPLGATAQSRVTPTEVG